MLWKKSYQPSKGNTNLYLEIQKNKRIFEFQAFLLACVTGFATVFSNIQLYSSYLKNDSISLSFIVSMWFCALTNTFTLNCLTETELLDSTHEQEFLRENHFFSYWDVFEQTLGL